MTLTPDDDHLHVRTPRHLALRLTFRLVLMTLLASLVAGCQATLFAGINATAKTSGVEATNGVIYEPAQQLKLDIYRPAQASGKLPVVVFFYGGSWQSGKRQWYRFVGEALARRGVVVVIPTYREYPQVTMDGFMRDGASAVAWARAHAADYGGDPAKLFVMGHSAGAHIGGLLATDARWLKSVGMTPRQLAGFIGLAGPYDFLPLQEKVYVKIFGQTHRQQLQSQPIHFVDGDEPPMLLMQGLKDKIVDPKNTRSLAAALTHEGEPVETKFYPDVGHITLLLSLSRPFRGKSQALDDTVDFIEKQATAPIKKRAPHS